MSDLRQRLLLLDRMNELGHDDPLHAFALDELLCRRAGREMQAICHIWRHPQAFILGTQDSRLPFAQEAMHELELGDWRVAVRNSGGAAVPLDGGVVNVSLIIPNTGMKHSGYMNDFEAMFLLIRDALGAAGRHVAVEKGEVPGAYCPGDYDLSIGGYKFCGIAQRRQVRATVIQAFVVAEGSGRARAELVRAFYDIASGGDASLGHPIVTGNSTASLEELAGMGPLAGFAFANALGNLIGGGRIRPGDKASSAMPLLPEPAEIAEMASALRERYTARS